MISKNRIIAFGSAFFGVCLILISFSFSANAQTLYSCVSPSDGEDPPLLRVIDLDTGDTLSAVEIILSGETLKGCNGLAKDPTTGVCFIMLSPPGGGGGTPGARILATINPFTGQASEIGNTGLPFAGMAFDNSGTLYGLTGDQNGAADPTLYTLSKQNGSPTLV